MQSDSWEQIQSVFLAAADLAGSERARYLDDACAGDPILRREVESLLQFDQARTGTLNSLVVGQAQSFVEAEAADVHGSRLGVWLLIRELGRGGMGTVYLAARDDHQFQMQAALKLVRHGMDTEDVLNRFRHERQILANLDHPYIARLLDGGTSPDGRPFFVMEYVQGKAVDKYCRDEWLSTEDKVRLFLKICEAVAHAHRNLVVHRDLKPGNIFITGDGSPKLLDFGVAKLLAPQPDSSAALTVASSGPLTPDYASPEQLKAEKITTATDVYSLGAILYELLTGVRAHRFSSYSASDIERVICEVDPQKPSVVAPQLQNQLRGDLDAIIAKAMRKEPSLRYASVEPMAADLQGWLEGGPVSAHRGSFSYRSAKYVRRNAVALVGGTVLGIALFAGAGVAGWQAIRAGREQSVAEASQREATREAAEARKQRASADQQRLEAEQQRREAEQQRREADLQRIGAETQRALADRRFEQVRQLAGKFLLDFHDSIATLPGSIPARKMVVETGLHYYDTLVREASGNRQLLEEIARGYDRLGDVQGNPYYANLGDVKGAEASYRKAIAIRDGVTDAAPAFTSEWIRGRVKLAQVLVAEGELKRAETLYNEALHPPGRVGPEIPNEIRDALSNAWSAFGDLKIRIGLPVEALAAYDKLLAMQEGLGGDRGISLAHTKLGDAYFRLARLPEAFDHLRIALAIDTRLAAAEPDNMPLTRKLYVTYSFLGRTLRGRGAEGLATPEEATSYIDGAVRIAEKMAAADPDNRQQVADLAMAQTGRGDWLLERRNDAAGAVAAYRKAVTAGEKLGAMEKGQEDILVQVHQRLAAGLAQTGEFAEALDHFREASNYLARLEAQNPGLSRNANRRGDILRGRADVFKRQKQWNNAVEAWSNAIAIFEAQAAREPGNLYFPTELPDLYVSLASAEASAGRAEAASAALQKALERFRQLERLRPLSPSELEARQNALADLNRSTVAGNRASE